MLVSRWLPLKRYTLPLLAGLSSCPPTSPLHAQPQQDEGPSYGDWTAEEPLVAVGTGVPRQNVSRSGRIISMQTGCLTMCGIISELRMWVDMLFECWFVIISVEQNVNVVPQMF